jgi:sec-independent protein translocase protein TatC
LIQKFLSNKSKNAADDQNEMGFFDHIEVLRWHIVRSLLSIIVLGVVFFLNQKFTFETLVLGPKNQDFITYRLIKKLIPDYGPPNFDLITREMGEQFFVHLKVSFWMGLICSFPYIFWEFWRFLKPGLYDKEKKAVKGIVFYCSMLFFTGVCFGYFIIAPLAVTWLTSYSVGAEVISSPTLASYVGYMTMFTIPTGILFELPIIFYFLGKIGLVSSAFLRKYRRHSIVIIFVIAAIVTPPDVITQILIAIPILFLYEISIYLVKKQEKSNQASTNLPSNE